ncbi:MAG TPA: MBL fold metallo-hydrolase [Bryobacteraceae bacterium]|jgi:L-ascorbate metabolism protein UlaG (beta-lactamase superfamily)|nr:MBL fold metallo-hydrolase [Bryobacteraceae bacterium]
MPELTMTYIGGPTAHIQLGGLRFLTDPTFDPAGTEYPTAVYTLKKWAGPAIGVDRLGPLDAVLLSHDHHYDNLDHAGRQALAGARQVFTTVEGAGRLGGHAVGLAHWQSIEMAGADGRTLRVTGTPARHGPSGGDRGPVTGFVLAFSDTPDDCLYLSGDTVWYEGIEEVAHRFQVTTAVLFLGAARVREVGPDHLTMTAEEAVRAARLFQGAVIVPLHYAGWAHFSESREDIQRAFAAAGLGPRLCWLEPGVPTAVSKPSDS